MWTSAELKIRAKGAFKKNYGFSILTALVMAMFIGVLSFNVVTYIKDFLQDYLSASYLREAAWWLVEDLVFSNGRLTVSISIGGVFTVLVKVFLGNVLFVGGCRFFIINQTMNPTAAELGYGFSPGRYGRIVKTMFLKNLFINLWSLLLFFPGVVKRYEYMMIPYILAENPEMEWREAFLISRQMMDGQKLNAFCLDLTFIGWQLAEIFTFGIAGLLYVEPYYQATIAELYTVNRTIAYQNGYIR